MTAGIIIGALALIAGAIWLLGSRAKKRLAAQYPPPGQMVDVGGFRMHIDCQGDPAAGPAVVMDSANGEPAQAWASVQPAVAEFAQVCSFDRAGLGWSESSPNPRTLTNYVEEQRTLLARAGVEPVLAENSHPLKDRPAGQHNPFGEPPEREPGTGFVDVRIPVLAQTQQKGLSDAI